MTSSATGAVLTASTWTGRSEGSNPGARDSPGNLSRGALSCSNTTTTVFGWTLTRRSRGCGSPVSFMPKRWLFHDILLAVAGVSRSLPISNDSTEH